MQQSPNRDPFGLLPVEIRAMILQLSEDVSDIRGTILASRPMLDVFRGSQRAAILKSVLDKMFTPEAKQDALAIVLCPQPSRRYVPANTATGLIMYMHRCHRLTRRGGSAMNAMPDGKTPWQMEAERFLASHFEKRRHWPSNINIEQLMRLCQVYRLVDRSIREFLRVSLGRLIPRRVRRDGPGRKEYDAWEINPREYARLQRAFTRYELLCGFLSLPLAATLAQNMYTAVTTSGVPAADLLIRNLPSFQLEEVRVVAAYVAKRYREWMQDAELDIGQAVERGMADMGIPADEQGRRDRGNPEDVEAADTRKSEAVKVFAMGMGLVPYMAMSAMGYSRRQAILRRMYGNVPDSADMDVILDVFSRLAGDTEELDGCNEV